MKTKIIFLTSTIFTYEKKIYSLLQSGSPTENFHIFYFLIHLLLSTFHVHRVIPLTSFIHQALLHL